MASKLVRRFRERKVRAAARGRRRVAPRYSSASLINYVAAVIMRYIAPGLRPRHYLRHAESASRYSEHFGDDDLRPRAVFDFSFPSSPIQRFLESVQPLPKILCRRVDPESQILAGKSREMEDAPIARQHR